MRLKRIIDCSLSRICIFYAPLVQWLKPAINRIWWDVRVGGGRLEASTARLARNARPWTVELGADHQGRVYDDL